MDRTSLIPWRVRRWIVTGSLFGIGAGCFGVLAAVVLMRYAPAWWKKLPLDKAETAERAGLLHNTFANRLHEIKQTGANADTEHWSSEVDRFTVSASDANAWLNLEMPRWLTNMDSRVAWPASFRELQVQFIDGRVHLGVKIHQGQRDLVLSATLVPDLRADGSLWMPATWVHVGRLPLPADWVLAEAEARADTYIPEELRDLPEAKDLFRVFSGEIPVADDATIRLMDGRRVRLLELIPRDGRIEVAFRQERTIR